jgi:hypothetical protein
MSWAPSSDFFLLEFLPNLRRLDLLLPCNEPRTAPPEVQIARRKLLWRSHASARAADRGGGGGRGGGNSHNHDASGDFGARRGDGQVPFSVDVLAEEARLSAGVDYLHVKIPVAPVDYSQEMSASDRQRLDGSDVDDDAARRQAELDHTRVPHLSCRLCGTVLLTTAPEKCLSLPSPYWQELADLWYCHFS